MRELKFRVWDLERKRWESKMGVYFDDGRLGDFSECFHNNAGPNDEKDYVVQQYTGLKDKNDKEIYEGDIVKWGMSTVDPKFFSLRIVEWNENQLIYKVLDPFKMSVDYLYESRQPSTRWCEVVGNIFENSDLLEVDEPN